MIKAAIFDMDGGLIDSEPYWQEAAIKAFAKAGVPNGGSQKKVEYDILDELDKIIAARGERMAGLTTFRLSSKAEYSDRAGFLFTLPGLLKRC